MSEELAVQSNDAEVKAVEPVENQVADAVAEVVPEVPATEEAPAEPKQDHEKNRIQKRIDKLTREKYEALAEAKAYKMMLDQNKPAEVPENGKPQKSQYATDEDFVEALTDWKLDQREQATSRSKEQESHTAQVSEWNKRADQARKEYADFDDALEMSQDVPIHRSASKAILESDMAADIQYFLAKNPEQAEATVRMSPEGAARFVGRIEAQIASEKANRASQAARVSKAPVPIVPVKPVGGGSGHIDLHDPKVDMKTWINTRNSQLQT